MFERLREKDLKDDPDHRKVCPTGWNDNEKPYHYRIDATKGYIPGNIRIISWRATMKIKPKPEIEKLYHCNTIYDE